MASHNENCSASLRSYCLYAVCFFLRFFAFSFAAFSFDRLGPGLRARSGAQAEKDLSQDLDSGPCLTMDPRHTGVTGMDAIKSRQKTGEAERKGSPGGAYGQKCTRSRLREMSTLSVFAEWHWLGKPWRSNGDVESVGQPTTSLFFRCPQAWESVNVESRSPLIHHAIASAIMHCMS
jgi:hypothetical protein